MNNAASILILIFLGITFIQSSSDKVIDWKGNLEFMKAHFAETSLKKLVAIALFHLLIMELLSGILCIVGCIQLIINGGRIFGLYGAIISCITLIMLLTGQRIAKDYDGARTIVIYFIPSIMAVYW
ncbi:DoxX family protein, partial [Flavobacterium branchiophilum]